MHDRLFYPNMIILINLLTTTKNMQTVERALAISSSPKVGVLALGQASKVENMHK